MSDCASVVGSSAQYKSAFNLRRYYKLKLRGCPGQCHCNCSSQLRLLLSVVSVILDHEFGWLPAMSGCTLLLAAQHVGARGSAYVLRFSQRGAICTVAMVYPKAIHTPALAV